MNLAVFFSYKIYDLKSLSCVQNVQVLFFRDARAVFAINMFNGKVRTNKADSSDVNNSFIFFIQCVCALRIIFGQIERAANHLSTWGKGILPPISGDILENFSSITFYLKKVILSFCVARCNGHSRHLASKVFQRFQLLINNCSGWHLMTMTSLTF